MNHIHTPSESFPFSSGATPSERGGRHSLSQVLTAEIFPSAWPRWWDRLWAGQLIWPLTPSFYSVKTKSEVSTLQQSHKGRTESKHPSLTAEDGPNVWQLPLCVCLGWCWVYSTLIFASSIEWWYEAFLHTCICEYIKWNYFTVLCNVPFYIMKLSFTAFTFENSCTLLDQNSFFTNYSCLYLDGENLLWRRFCFS